MKQIKQNGLKYLINEEENKAEIIGYCGIRNSFLIPRSIKYESQEYIVQSISKNAFEKSRNLKSIQFASDSELQTIEEGAFSCSLIESIFIPPHVTKIGKDAFSYCIKLQRIDIPSNSELHTIERNAFLNSSIKSIFIPASLTNLKEGWCKNTNKLTTVKVDPRNPRYSNYKDKIIVCKTTETSEKFDKIVFVGRDIKEITIPSFIKTIGSCAFSSCSQLQRINFPSNSELQTIENGAFFKSSIESIIIPPHVIKICKEAFSDCENLRIIDIPSNSELQTIEKNAFLGSSIESIFIPARVIDLKEGWCNCLYDLKKVKIDPRNSRCSYLDDKMIIYKTSESNENYDEIVFGRRDIKEITIPSFIKIIGSYAFELCDQLQRIDISSNSELQTIEKKAFADSSIERIFIPPHVTKIGEYAFSDCQQLQRIDIPSNSELQTIEEGAFSKSSIRSFFMPLNVTEISKNVFFGCIKLYLIEINEKLEIELHDISSFFPSETIIMVPNKQINEQFS